LGWPTVEAEGVTMTDIVAGMDGLAAGEGGVYGSGVGDNLHRRRDVAEFGLNSRHTSAAGPKR
jgi:hypothetical protein